MCSTPDVTKSYQLPPPSPSCGLKPRRKRRWPPSVGLNSSAISDKRTTGKRTSLAVGTFVSAAVLQLKPNRRVRIDSSRLVSGLSEQPWTQFHASVNKDVFKLNLETRLIPLLEKHEELSTKEKTSSCLQKMLTAYAVFARCGRRLLLILVTTYKHFAAFYQKFSDIDKKLYVD